MTNNKNGIKLSNKVIKAYLKKDRQNIVFHLNSHLLVSTTSYFESTELRNIKGHFAISKNEKIHFSKTSWVVSDTYYDYNFNGKIKIIQIHLIATISFKTVNWSSVEINIICEFKSFNARISSVGVLNKMYDERRFPEYNNLIK